MHCYLVIALVLGLVSLVAAADPVEWTEIGVAPYNPKGDKQLDLKAPAAFVSFGVLGWTDGAEIMAMIDAGRFERAVLKRGRICRAMMSHGKIDVPVRFAWKHYAAVDARLYRPSTGTEYYIVDRCGNPVICDPEQAVAPPALPAAPTNLTVTASPPAVEILPAPAEVVYTLRVNFFRDRDDNFWREKYFAAELAHPSGAYRMAFVNGAPFEFKVKERETRPISSGGFNVRFWSGYETQQKPGTEVYSTHVEVQTMGFAMVPILRFLWEKLDTISVEADPIPDIIERYIFVRKPELEKVPTAFNFWFVQGRNVDSHRKDVGSRR